MSADNNLYKNAKSDINEMLENQEIFDGNLIVYLDAPSWSEDSIPKLFKIQSGKIYPVKQYNKHNSATGDVLQTVINDVVKMFEAKSYGLVLWSHGTGWLPKNSYENFTKSLFATNILKIKQQISKIVIYNDFTPYFLNIEIRRSCGISIYISTGNNELDNKYKLLDWHKDSKIAIL
jgi:hypothetical protein